MGKKLDALLIKPGSQKILYGRLSSESLTAIEPPLWAGLMATFLRNRGYSVKIIDVEAEGLSLDELVGRIEALSPLVVGIVVSGTNPSASTMNMTGARLILEELARRNIGIKTAIAGLHPSALPEQTMREERVDFLCEGEAFYTFADLIEALKDHYERSDFPIKGLWYRKNGEIVSNERAPLIKDLDREIPHVAWDLLPMDRYRAHNWHCFQEGQVRQPYAVIYTSLGCPFKCHFCCINAIFGKPGIRYKSPEVVVDEIGHLVETYGVKNIKLIDEMFVLNERHVLSICELITKRGYDLNIWAYARINTVNERLLKSLRQAGFKWLAYGIESGNDRVLKSVTKGITVEKTKDVIRMTQEQDINVIGNYIFGLPEDDLESMEDTLQLAMELNCEFANMYCATAYPGSPLYAQAVKEGWKLPETWSGYSPYSYDHLPLPTKYLSPVDVLRFRDTAYVRYYSNERYHELVRRKFGESVLSEIKSKLTTPLRRKYLEQERV